MIKITSNAFRRFKLDRDQIDRNVLQRNICIDVNFQDGGYDDSSRPPTAYLLYIQQLPASPPIACDASS